MESNLNVQSTTQPTRPLSYNEWCDKFQVSTKYIEPTKYFQGNPTSGIEPLKLQRVGNSFLNLFFKS